MRSKLQVQFLTFPLHTCFCDHPCPKIIRKHSQQSLPHIITASTWTCRNLFQQYLDKLPSTVKQKFALPGIERQDSVYSGLQEIRPDAALVAVHDSARPLLDPVDAAACMADAQEVCTLCLRTSSCITAAVTLLKQQSASMHAKSKWQLLSQ